jgi:hypothetical protein
VEDNKLIDKNIGLLSSFNFSFNYEKEKHLFIRYSSTTNE